MTSEETLRLTTMVCADASMGWLRLVGSLKLQVSFAKEPYKKTMFCKGDL